MSRIAVAAIVLLAIGTTAALAQSTETGNAAYTKLKSAIAADPSLRTADYAGLAFYAAQNAALPAPGPHDPPRVVFLGDSITHNWGNKNYSDLFQRHTNFVNRGIGGQTTAQMLLRFRDDVLALHPRLIVFLGGTNDLATYKVPDVVAFIASNIQSIVELAQVHHIPIILSTVMPVTDAIKPQTDRRDPAKILAVNAWLRSYATANHIPLVDYYAALNDGHDRMPASFTADGLHPNHEGMSHVDPLIEAAIAAELKHAK